MKTWLIVLLVLVAGCITPKVPSTPSSPPSIESFTVPDRVYQSREKMNITVYVNGPQNLENASLRVYGIHSRYYRLDKTQIINLTAGPQKVVIDYTTPSCFGCARISPGKYNVTAELYVSRELIDNKTLVIEIKE